MGNIKIHKVLCHGDFEAARQHTLNFFAKTMLLHYDAIDVVREESFPVTSPRFWPELEDGIAQNKQIMTGYLQELQDMDCHYIADLADLEFGYPSKVLHLVAHFLDGFIGIDSVFYSLPEDSHWLSDKLRLAIIDDPDSYWLLHVVAGFKSAGEAAIVHK